MLLLYVASLGYFLYTLFTLASEKTNEAVPNLMASYTMHNGIDVYLKRN